MHRAPGIPRALCLIGRKIFATARAHGAAGHSGASDWSPLTEGDHKGRPYKERHEVGAPLWAPCTTRTQGLDALSFFAKRKHSSSSWRTPGPIDQLAFLRDGSRHKAGTTGRERGAHLHNFSAGPKSNRTRGGCCARCRISDGRAAADCSTSRCRFSTQSGKKPSSGGRTAMTRAAVELKQRAAGGTSIAEAV